MTLLCVMSVEVNKFKRLEEEYETCLEFGEIHMMLRDESNLVVGDYYC